ncbi:hypothetical protein R1sor_025182 [Riccia sorocarpa]|uniref:Fungal lipase-type domain-containing protein n=1 Tax=Riccia sorocarpa TaxID=122646 RepID=A0ABD3GBR8_9MARC
MSRENQILTVSGYEAPKANIAKRWRELQGSNNWEGLLSPLDLDLRREILRYGDFVQVTGDSFPWEKKSPHPWACPFKKSALLKNVGQAETGYEVTRYLYSHLHGFKDEIQEVNWIGYVGIAVDPEEIERLGRRDIIVVWRGTTTDIEWQQDCLFPQIQPTSVNGKPVPKDVRVSRGFWGAFADFDPQKSVFGINGSAGKQMTEEVKRLIRQYAAEELSITCLGHSLGGALATCCAYQIAEDSINQTPSGTTIPVTAFTFASPRVGNIAFRERFKTLGVKVEQTVKKTKISDVLGLLVNKLGDLILPDDYAHVGLTLALDFTKSSYLKQPGKLTDLNSVENLGKLININDAENLGKYHNLGGYVHLVNGIFGGGKGGLDKPFKPVVIRDLAPVNKHDDLLAEPYAKNVPANWWTVQLRSGLKQNKDGFWLFPDVHGDTTKPNPDFD